METLPMPFRQPSAYERQAYVEIQRWKNPPPPSRLSSATQRVRDAMTQTADLVRLVPGVDWTIENVVAGLLRLTNEIVQDSVWRDAVYKEYRQAGFAIAHGHDLWELDLEHVDRAATDLSAKYRALAAVEGAATGAAGAAGIVPDVVALVALNLRAIGEYATYHGFDVTGEGERLYALHLLNLMSESGSAARKMSLSPVVRVTHRVARGQAAQAMEQFAVTRAIASATRALGERLARAKLAQLLPVTGSVIASGFNASYTRRVCTAARHLYRERFLVQKYGLAPFEADT
jgi:hypothetical protein